MKIRYLPSFSQIINLRRVTLFCFLIFYFTHPISIQSDIIERPDHSIKTSRIISMEFSSDGGRLLYTASLAMYLYDIERKENALKTNKFYLCNDTSFAPDQRQIAIAGREDFCIFDIKDGSYFTLRADTGCCKYAADGKRLLVGNKEGSGWISIFDTYTWNELAKFQISEFTPFSIVISPDQFTFAIVPNRGDIAINNVNAIPEVYLYNLQTYKLIRVIKSKYWREIRKAVFTNDGKILFTHSAHDYIEKWDAETGERLGECFVDRPICDIAITPDNRYLFIVEDNKTVKILDAKTYKHIHTLKTIQKYLDNIIEISPDGRYAAVASQRGGTIDFWNIDRILNQPSNTPTETSSDVPTETQTATPTPWRTPFPTPTNTPTMETAVRKYTLGSPGKDDDPGIISKCLFHPDGKRILTFDNKQRLIIWNKQTEEIQKILYSDVRNPEVFQLTDEERHLWVGGSPNGYTLEGWDIETGEKFYSKHWNYDEISSGDILPDESAFIYGSFKNTTVQYDYTNDRVVRQYDNSSDLPYARYIKVSNEGDRIAVIESSNNFNPRRSQATIWDIQSGKILSVVSLDERIIDGVFWSPDDKYIYLHSWGNRPDRSLDDYYIDQIESETGNHVFRFVYQDGGYYDLSPDRMRLIVTRQSTNAIRPRTNFAEIVDFYSGETLHRYPHINSITSYAFSQDGSEILVGTNNSSEQTAAVHLWPVGDLPTTTIPTLVPFTPTPTLSPTPTYTPSHTPTPDTPWGISPDVESTMLMENIEVFDFHPQTGDLVYLGFRKDENDQSILHISTLESNDIELEISYQSADVLKSLFSYQYNPISDMTISPNGKIYLIRDKFRSLYELNPDVSSEPVKKWQSAGTRLHAVSESDRIPNTKAGDILILRRPGRLGDNDPDRYLGERLSEVAVVDSSAENEFETLIEFPRGVQIADMTVGPDSRLYFITQEASICKILFLNDEGNLEEYIHFHVILPSTNIAYQYNPIHFTYLPADHSFIINAYYELIRLSLQDRSISKMASLYSYSKIKSSPKDSQTFYVNHCKTREGIQNLYSIKIKNPSGTPTPTPPNQTPTETPTAVPAWFMLDGFGGIHTSDPNVKPPFLPYFPDFDIVRDIEPDPLGGGWYMLDGYGGIHRSSPDLPMPEGLPYFGFDISRNLEIRVEDGQYKFYLMDAYGVVHTNGEPFNFGFFPWFGKTVMRDLEPDPNGNGWIEMDEKGYMYWNEFPQMDSIWYVYQGLIPSAIRGFKRYPDDRTVLIDYYGGRHTNPYHPLDNQDYGRLNEIYFAGWEIIWDLEEAFLSQKQ